MNARKLVMLLLVGVAPNVFRFNFHLGRMTHFTNCNIQIVYNYNLNIQFNPLNNVPSVANWSTMTQGLFYLIEVVIYFQSSTKNSHPVIQVHCTKLFLYFFVKRAYRSTRVFWFISAFKFAI